MSDTVEMLVRPSGSARYDESLTRPGTVYELHGDGSTTPLMVLRSFTRLRDRQHVIEVARLTPSDGPG